MKGSSKEWNEWKGYRKKIKQTKDCLLSCTWWKVTIEQ